MIKRPSNQMGGLVPTVVVGMERRAWFHFLRRFHLMDNFLPTECTLRFSWDNWRLFRHVLNIPQGLCWEKSGEGLIAATLLSQHMLLNLQ